MNGVVKGRWRAIGAAVAFVVAALADLMGAKVASRLTPALVTFAVIGLALTYWPSRGQVKLNDGGESMGGLVNDSLFGNLRGSQGGQVGDNNEQQNYFGSQRRD
jgi:hypothetical protein